MANTKNKNQPKNIFKIMLDKFKINFKSLFITNLIFSIPFIIIQVSLWVTFEFIPMNVFIYLLPIILLAPFYTGLVYVSKEIIVGNTIHKYKTFLSGIKKNFKQSLILGVIYYLIILISYFAIAFYYAAGLKNSFFFIMLGLAVILSLLIFMTLFYAPILTVTIDLKIKHIIKNSFLMAVFEIPTNFMIILSIAVIATIISMIFFLLSNALLITIFTCILSVTILPVLIAFIISNLTYLKVEKLFIGEVKPTENVIEKEPISIEEELKTLNITKEMLNSSGDYIFVNGKMIKKSIAKTYLSDEENIEIKN